MCIFCAQDYSFEYLQELAHSMKILKKQKLMQYKSVFGHELEKDEVKRLDPSTINTQSPLSLQGKA